MKLYYNADISTLNTVLNSFSLDAHRVRFGDTFVSSLALKVAEYIKSAYLDINHVLSCSNDDSNVIINDEFSAADFTSDYYDEVISGYASLLVYEFGNSQDKSSGLVVDMDNDLYSMDTPYEDQRDLYIADLIYGIVSHMHEIIGENCVVAMNIINVYDVRILYEIYTE